jgi:glycosyltransferase involved in cell wall biosynthesis
MSAEPIVALLGHPDEPTDGVADYCAWLGDALQSQGYACSIQRVNWTEQGWRSALGDLRKQAAAWHNRWVLLQFTTLAWSRRGFPWHAPEVLSVLRESAVRCCIVFHDFAPLDGKRLVDRARAASQLRAVRQLYQNAERAVFPVPLKLISWLPRSPQKAVFIPVGANCPSLLAAPRRDPGVKTIVVHSVTGGHWTAIEVADIAGAVKRARPAAGPLKLVVLGRGSREADAPLRSELAGTDVTVETLGLLPAEQISRILAHADVLLFARGQISSRRGSALAGIACGLPIVCYAGTETVGPITEAGIVAVPLRDREALAVALERVLTDASLREALAQRSRAAQQKYFSWQVIAAQFAAILRDSSESSSGEANAEMIAVARQG